jgi:hypothetical protein
LEMKTKNEKLVDDLRAESIKFFLRMSAEYRSLRKKMNIWDSVKKWPERIALKK